MVYIGLWDPWSKRRSSVSELESSDLIVFIVHLTTGRLASLKLIENGWVRLQWPNSLDHSFEHDWIRWNWWKLVLMASLKLVESNRLTLDVSSVLSTIMSMKCEDIRWVDEELSFSSWQLFYGFTFYWHGSSFQLSASWTSSRIALNDFEFLSTPCKYKDCRFVTLISLVEYCIRF